jgi:phosphatidylinositol glycan class U
VRIHPYHLDTVNLFIVQEGVFLYTHNVSPYDGGIYHQAPLLLPLFSLLPDPTDFPIATDILYTVVDLLSANALAQVAESGQAVVTRLFTSSRKDLRWSSLALAAGYDTGQLASRPY